jgi:hypothetical protein
MCAPSWICPSSVSRCISSSCPPFSVAAHPSRPPLRAGSVLKLPWKPHHRLRSGMPSAAGELHPSTVLASRCVTDRADLPSVCGLGRWKSPWGSCPLLAADEPPLAVPWAGHALTPATPRRARVHQGHVLAHATLGQPSGARTSLSCPRSAMGPSRSRFFARPSRPHRPHELGCQARFGAWCWIWISIPF